MTPNELTDIIATELGAIGDFTFKRTILARANSIRAAQLKRTLEKRPMDRMFFTQSIQVTLENFNTLENVGELVCTHSRSTCSVPDPLRSNNIMYDYVGSIDGSNAYRYTTQGAGRFISAGPYGDKYNLYHREGGRIVVHKPGVPRILVVGIFEDTEEAYNIDAKSRGCTSCDYWESKYPATEDVIDIIINEIVQKWKTDVVNLEANGTQNRPDQTA